MAELFTAKVACAMKDYDRGAGDCTAGVYDKWYRYNRSDDGAAYDAGWTDKNEEVQNDSVKIIKIQQLWR